MDMPMMPTAAKFVGALFFAGLAFFAASLIFNYFPEGSQPGRFPFICMLFGALFGYRWSGRRATGSYRSGFGNGLTTVFLICLWCLFIFAFARMYDNATSLRYDGVMDALQDMVKMMVENARKYLLHYDVAALLILGGLFGGWITERTARAWP